MSIQNIIKGSPLFHDLYDEEVNTVLKKCSVMQLAPGENVFNEGDKGEDLYLILSGKVDIIKKGMKIATLGKSELFGELILVYEGTRSTDATASAHSDILVLSYQSILQMYEKNPRAMSIMLLNLSRLMAERLKKSNNDIRELHVTLDNLLKEKNKAA